MGTSAFHSDELLIASHTIMPFNGRCYSQNVSLTSLSMKLRCLAQATTSGGLELARIIPLSGVYCTVHHTLDVLLRGARW